MTPEDGQYDSPTMEIDKPRLEIQSTGVHFIPSKKPSVQPSPGPSEEKPKKNQKKELDMEVFGYQLNLTGVQNNQKPNHQVDNDRNYGESSSQNVVY